MSEFRVREARRHDVDAIGTMWRELMRLHVVLDPRFAVSPEGEKLYRRHIEEMLRSRDGRVLVAETIGATDGATEPVGYLLGEIHARSPLVSGGQYGLLSDIFVWEVWRKQGVGKALFTEIRRWFKDRKVGTMQLYVATANPEAFAFWQSVGMHPFMQVLQLDLTEASSPVSSSSAAEGRRSILNLFSLKGENESEQQ